MVRYDLFCPINGPETLAAAMSPERVYPIVDLRVTSKPTRTHTAVVIAQSRSAAI
jgi:hypothetical protein